MQLNPPLWKVIKTAIYGVRPSGNLAECGLRKTAELARSECPKAYDVIMNDVYVDDCMSGDNSSDDALQVTEQLSVALAKGGFSLKGFTFSGKDPPDHLSDDGESITVGGLKWFSRDDLISLNIPELNYFSKKNRGKKSQDTVGKIPERLIRRDCVSKVAEVFDPLGRATPLTSGLKIDLNQLTLRKLDWDDLIPNDLRQVWVSNFEMIQEIGTIRFKRAVVPADAADLSIETLDFADANQTMICVAIYARFKRKSGGHSCQLVFARSKVVARDMSMPRAELLAASLNAATGHIVKTAFGNKHSRCWKLSDSQVVLHWVGSSRSRLKMCARNRVIEINRLVDVSDWWYVESSNMVADLGTRKGLTVAEVGPHSIWINGFQWMSGDESGFPLKSASDIMLNGECKREALKEAIVVDVTEELLPTFSPVYLPTRQVPDFVGERYTFSQYVIDPNQFRFRKVVRVLALVYLFVKNVLAKRNKVLQTVLPDSVQGGQKQIPDMLTYQWDRYLVTTGIKTECKGGLVVDLSKPMLNAALQYYFKKATDEIKHFLPESRYKNISEQKDGVLHYTGRILPTQEFGGQLSLCDVSFDLSKATFCVPIVDNLSPIAYSIANEIHWYHPDVKHGGVESVLRQVQCIAYVIGGRKLIKSMKRACTKCRLLEKKEIEVTMGSKHESNLCIAPAFHNTQVDICGPFESYSNSNKRAKVKIWFVVFCCSTTGAVDCKVMEDYSADSFILAFIRFSCRYGYPCNLYPDYGSQLIKGCKDMVLSFSDIKYKLNVEFGINFETCPVGAHYVHGKVERKIGQIKRSLEKELSNCRLSVIQWETLGQQIVNSINNLPIGLGNKTEYLENLDLITPNRLLLGRNNDRCPTAPLILSRDVKRIIAQNSEIFKTWFKSWLVSFVPTLAHKPKWFKNDRDISVGDIVLFTKSEKEFEDQYQYGMVTAVSVGKDGHIRTVDIEYRNHNEEVKRVTNRGVRDIVLIHPVDELSISEELFDLANETEHQVVTCNCSTFNN